MKDYNLVIKIASPWVVEKLDMRAKYNSVLFVDYTKIVEDIFDAFNTDKEFNLFRFELYTSIQNHVHIKKYSNWYRLESWEIYIDQSILAICLPRDIRRRFFKRDSFYEKRFLKNDLNYHYYL